MLQISDPVFVYNLFIIKEKPSAPFAAAAPPAGFIAGLRLVFSLFHIPAAARGCGYGVFLCFRRGLSGFL